MVDYKPNVEPSFTANVKDCICTSCGKPIFYLGCPHIVGQQDEHGKVVGILINRIENFYEVSIVDSKRLGDKGCN